MSVKILNENLKTGKFSSLYYIFGEEEYLKNHYFGQLKSKVVTEFVEFNVIEFNESNFSFLDFSNTVNSYPVMSDKKLVCVTDFDNSLLKKDFTKEFGEFLKNIPDFCVVVFFDTILKPYSKSNPLEKVITSSGGISVEVKKPDLSSLTNWAMRHFKNSGKVISVSDIHYLIDITDNDMMSLSNEISKLCNYVDSDEISKSDIDSLTTKSVETNRYEIADAFCGKNYTKIFSILDKLYKQNVDDIIIANVFYRAFSDMWKAKLAMKNGKTSSELASDFKLNPYAAGKIIKNSKLVTLAVLQYALERSLKLDREMKSLPYNKKDLIISFIGEIISYRDSYEKNIY